MLDNHATLLSRAESRQIDQAAVDELGLTGVVLMENAARGVCDVILREPPFPTRIIICCGPGNNGGDGFALARQLAARGVEATVFLTAAGKPLTHDAEFNRDIWLAAGYCVKDGDHPEQICDVLSNLGKGDLIVDCLLGTGIRGAVRAPFGGIIEAMNSSNARVLAVDVPSGMDCETGEAEGAAVLAQRTVTFVARKIGFSQPCSEAFTGMVEVAHIGIPNRWVCDWLERYRSASD